jgi:hypothetical protein
LHEHPTPHPPPATETMFLEGERFFSCQTGYGEFKADDLLVFHSKCPPFSETDLSVDIEAL